MILAATGLKREARIIARPGVFAIAGGGDDARLEAELEAWAGEASAIMSVGLAGALIDELRPGNWVIGGILRTPAKAGAQIRPSAGPRPSPAYASVEIDPRWAARVGRLLPHARIGAVHADSAMVADAAAKRALHSATGAIAVDMESHVAARVAARHGLPFAILRVISDGVDHSLPPAARIGIRPDGGMEIGAVLASLARNPAQLAALIRTGRDANVAFRSLLRGYDVLARFGFGLADEGELPLDMG